GPLDPAARQQFPPAPGAFLVRGVDAGCIEIEAARTQPRHRQKTPRSALVEFQKHVLAALGCHLISPSKPLTRLALRAIHPLPQGERGEPAFRLNAVPPSPLVGEGARRADEGASPTRSKTAAAPPPA